MMDEEESEKLLEIMNKSEPISNDHNRCTFVDMSHELLCHILQYLPLYEILSISMLCRKLFTSVSMYLRLCKTIDFCEGKIYGCMPASITDDHMHAFFRKCPHVENVYGLHPQKVERRRLRGRAALTVPGIIEALNLCGNLKAVEISDLRLLEAIMQHLPQLEIIGNFQNRDGVFPPHASHRLKLQPYPRISSLHLIGVEVPELTAMPHLEHLHLQCVRFTKLQPFRGFLAQRLKSFVMKHCMGPSMSLRYLSLIIALSSSPSLSRLELVRVPLPGGLFQRAIEDSYRHNGFVNLKHLVISGCKGVLESDLGHLMIVSSKNLESISIQPSLTRDSLFVSLSFAQCEFPKLRNLHLGFVDKLSISGNWSNDTLLTLGLAEIPDTPSSLTDNGMKIIIELFPKLRSLSVSNCPHLMAMDQWYNSLGEPVLQELTDLTLQRCHCLQLPTFALFLAFLPKVEVVVLNDMFREPPKGCSHVGLSAGTGLGMSSAVVSNQDEQAAVHGHQQDFDAQGDDPLENEEIERDFIDVDNGRNQEPHLMVLQQEFFDDQNNVAGAPIERVEQDRNIDSDEAEQPRRSQDQQNNVQGLLNTDSESEGGKDDNQDLVSKNEECSYSKNKRTSKSCRGKCPKGKNSSVALSESPDDDSDASVVAKKQIKVKSQQAGKKKGFNKRKKPDKKKQSNHNCLHSFDPSQPSTSKSVPCCCRCDSSDPEMDIDSDSCLLNSCSSSKQDHLEYSDESGSPEKIKRTLDDDDDQNSTLSPSNCKTKKFKKDDDLKTESDAEEEIGYNSSGDYNVNCSDSEVFTAKRCKKDRKSSTETRDEKKYHKTTSSRKNKSRKTPSFAKARDSLVKKCQLGDNHPDNCPYEHRIQQQKEEDFSNDESVDGVDGSNDESSAIAAKGGKCSASRKTTRPTAKRYKRRKFSRKQVKNGKKSKSLKHSKQCQGKKSSDSYNLVSEGTQATSADIRRSHRRQKTSPSPKRRVRRNNIILDDSISDNISVREQHKRPKQRSDYNVQNKATSTSDPLMEDDAVQILRLVSESLISLSVISCGISDLIVDHCHTLTHIEVQACRIVKKLQLLHCPYLQRFNISQCPKLEMDIVVPEVLSLVSNTNLLISYEPYMKIYYPGVSEKILFQRAYVDQSVILVHDYTSEANENIQATFQENLLGWMGIVQKMHNSALPRKAKHKKKRSKRREPKLKYPWGHQLRRIHGLYTFPPSADCDEGKWKYQILTNDRLFAAAIEVMSWEKGIPPPCRSLECEAENQFLSTVTKELFNKKLLRRLITFYIPVMEGDD